MMLQRLLYVGDCCDIVVDCLYFALESVTCCHLHCALVHLDKHSFTARGLYNLTYFKVIANQVKAFSQTDVWLLHVVEL